MLSTRLIDIPRKAIDRVINDDQMLIKLPQVEEANKVIGFFCDELPEKTQLKRVKGIYNKDYSNLNIPDGEYHIHTAGGISFYKYDYDGKIVYVEDSFKEYLSNKSNLCSEWLKEAFEIDMFDEKECYVPVDKITNHIHSCGLLEEQIGYPNGTYRTKYSFKNSAVKCYGKVSCLTLKIKPVSARTFVKTLVYASVYQSKTFERFFSEADYEANKGSIQNVAEIMRIKFKKLHDEYLTEHMAQMKIEKEIPNLVSL